MLFNTRQLYTPALDLYEFNHRALIIDTETIGAGPAVEIVEVAVGDCAGNLLFESLVRPAFNRLPPPSKHMRFDKAEFAGAPEWADVWPRLSALIDGRLLIAYNAGFDRRALAATCSRYRQTSPERGWRCAMHLVKKVIGTSRAVTLGQACSYFGVEGGNHRAGEDVRATYRLLKAIKMIDTRAVLE